MFVRTGTWRSCREVDIGVPPSGGGLLLSRPAALGRTSAGKRFVLTIPPWARGPNREYASPGVAASVARRDAQKTVAFDLKGPVSARRSTAPAGRTAPTDRDCPMPGLRQRHNPRLRVRGRS